MGLPCLTSAFLKFVAVEMAMSPIPIVVPTIKEAKGKALTPKFQPRCSWNVIGY